MRRDAGIIAMILSIAAGLASTQASSQRLMSEPLSGRPNAVAPGIKAAALWDGRKALEFHAANFPKMIPAGRATFLDDEEYVLGITVNGESRAYPTRFAAWHHIINDKLGKREKGGEKFVAITFCVVCNTGIRFDPVVNGKPLRFDFYGLYNGVMTMFDVETRSVWLQVGGRAVKGPLLGAGLKTEPVLDTTWKRWRRLHPDTLVMAPDKANRRNYDPDGVLIRRGFTHFPDSTFRKTLTHRDRRLSSFDMVLAVAHRAQSDTSASQPPIYRVYPLNALRTSGGVVNDKVGAHRITVFYEADTETAVALSPVVADNVLTFAAKRQANGSLAFYDKETGSRWNIEGQAVEGPLKDRWLNRLDSTMSAWYGWAAYFPQTSIYGLDGSATNGVAVSSSHESSLSVRPPSAAYKQSVTDRPLLANKR